MTSVPFSSTIPSFHPTETERISEIPERFLLEGLLSLTAEGKWYFEGDKIEHLGVQRFLSAQLQRTEEGVYWVVNGPQRVFVEVEDAPFLVHAVEVTPDALWAQLNDGSVESLRPESLRVGTDDVLYIRVKEGKAGARPGESHDARLTRQAVFQLAEFFEGEDGGKVLFLWKERRYPIEPK